LTWEGLKNVIARTAGQILYLSIGTVGLIWVGLISLSKEAIHKPSIDNNHTHPGNRPLAIFLLFSLIGIITESALLFASIPEAQRLDQWMYGRYVEGVIAPILLIGALTASLRTALWAVPIAVFAAVL